MRHDLRSSLAPLRMAVQLLRSEHLEASSREEALAVIERQVDQLLEGIEDVGELLRLQAGRYAYTKVRQDANLLLDLVCGRGALIRGLGERQLRLLCEPCAREALVEHDPVRVAEVLEYLLLRAADHTQPGAELKLALAQDGQGVELRLSGARNSLAEDEELRFLLGDRASGDGEPGLRALLIRAAIEAGGLRLARADAGSLSLRFAGPA